MITSVCPVITLPAALPSLTMPSLRLWLSLLSSRRIFMTSHVRFSIYPSGSDNKKLEQLFFHTHTHTHCH